MAVQRSGRPFVASSAPPHSLPATDSTGAASSVPSGKSAADVARVETALPQGRSNAAPDLEAVRAIDEHRRFRRELSAPLVHPLRIAPDRARHRIGIL